MKHELNPIVDAFQAGEFSKVIRLASLLLKRKPRHAFAWKALGTAQKQLGDLESAANSLAKALEYDFADAECHSNLSSTLTSMGRHTEALEAARNAVLIDQYNAEALLNLGVALRNQQRYNEAKDSYRAAIALKPSLIQAYVNLGNLYRITGELDRSIELCEGAIEQGLATPTLKLCLALSKRDAGYLYEARALCLEVLKSDPDHADAHNNLAVILIDAGLLEQAFSHCLSAIRLKPDFAEAYCNMGLICRDSGFPERAISYYRRAIKLNPDYFVALNNILFAINCCYRYRPRLADHYARQFRKLCKRSRSGSQYQSWTKKPLPAPIKVGLVSGDFGLHPVGYFLKSFLPKVDPKRLTMIAYSTKCRNDPVSKELLCSFSGFHRVDHLTDRDAAALIHAHQIDVLFDLSGHTLFNRLPILSYRPAPVQASWLGYFATTGLDEIDYIVGDRVNLPQIDQVQFREEIITLPTIYYSFSAPDPSPDISALPARRTKSITFGCFNSLAKLNQQVIACWAEILKVVSNSRLFLKARQYQDRQTVERISERFNLLGVDPSRVLFEAHSDRTSYLESYARVDMALDPFPYPGGTTTLEALWMGVPTLSRSGDRLIGRSADMILRAVGLTEWLAKSTKDYIEKAVCFSGHVDYLESLRAQLRDRLRHSKLMDAALFAEDFMTICETMHVQGGRANARNQPASEVS